jgi:hypothetical protein
VKKKHRSKAAVKKAFRKVGSSRKRVEQALSRKKKKSALIPQACWSESTSAIPASSGLIPLAASSKLKPRHTARASRLPLPAITGAAGGLTDKPARHRSGLERAGHPEARGSVATRPS